MGITDILRLAGGLGPTVTLLVLILAIGIGIGIMIFTIRSLVKSINSQSKLFSQQVLVLEQKSDKRDERLEQLLAEQNLRVAYIEQRYASKEDMYEALGGWKYEVGELRKRIDRHVERHNEVAT